MPVSKDKLRELFTKNWKKHYKTDFLSSKGFERKQCTSCKRFFWSIDSSRKICGDSTCNNFDFIGGKSEKISYVDMWRSIEKLFVKKGHGSISRYPTVCRWRDDLYFTNASIINFQPFVVTGEVEPPANPLIVPQPSLRFSDIENVGVTGQHYTSFIMFGQHAFNSKKSGLFYWKSEALEMDFEYLTKIVGVNPNDLAFQEEVWAGGGTFGPSLEYCAHGLELGNCVFMQYKDLGNEKYEELNTKVIDMGAGLERLAWYANKSATSYDVTFDSVLNWVLKEEGIKQDKEFFSKFAKISGIMDVDSGHVKENKEKAANQMGMSIKEMMQRVSEMQSIYAILDHVKTLMYAVGDGMMPSNGGGGYNLRVISRRAFSLAKEHNFNFDFRKVAELHAKSLKDFDPLLTDSLSAVQNVLTEEKRKYADTREKNKRMVKQLIEQKKPIDQKKLSTLYESYGITPELVQEEALKYKVDIEVPENFYGKLAKSNELKNKKEKWHTDISKYPATKLMYNEDGYLKKFHAKVIGIDGKAIILDKTIFYPEGGGQIGDSGIIEDCKVKDTQKKENVVLHFVDSPEKLKIGQKIYGEINWNRRLSIMKHHTATHLLNAACRHTLGRHIWQSGSLKTDKKAHLDITHFKKLTTEELEKIEFLVNKWIAENHEVDIKLFARNVAENKYGFGIYQGGYVPAKTLRIVNIEQIDVEACAGTHVIKTGEIGFFKIRSRESVQDGIERLEYSVGLEGLKFVQDKMRLIKMSSAILSVPEDDLPKVVRRLFDELKDLRKKQEKAGQNSASNIKDDEINKVIKSPEPKIMPKYFSNLNTKQLTQAANEFVKNNPKLTAVFASDNICIAIRGKDSSVEAIKPIANIQAILKGKGGGGNDFAQTFISDKNSLFDKIKTLREKYGLKD